MPYELLIGLRYTRSRKRAQGRNRFISFISLVSMLGIALGVAALIVVLSVMNGFQDELRARILGVASHVQIQAQGSALERWQQLAEEAATHPDVLASAPYVQEQGMLAHAEAVRGSMVRGIIPLAEEKVADFSAYMVAGELEALRPGGFGIILGRDLALALGVKLGDKLTLIAPQGLVTPAAVLPRVKQFELVGVFDAGMYEYDSGLALIHLNDAQTLYRLGDGVSGVRLKLDDLFAAPRVARELALQIREPGLWLSDWTRSHANFFRAVALEKTMMSLILFLIVAVAAFNIVAALVMVVNEKRTDIAILRTVGIAPRSIVAVFMTQGMVIGWFGTLLGMVLGLALALNVGTIVPFLEGLFGAHVFDPTVFVISEVPSEVRWLQVVGITVTALVLTVLATIYPALRGAATEPAEALRYE